MDNAKEFVIRNGVLTEYRGPGRGYRPRFFNLLRRMGTEVTIPSGVRSIGRRAFAGCERMSGVTIPEGVTSIDEGAFEGCRGLTEVTIPAGVRSIGGGAFSGCERLTVVSIPKSVTSIGQGAFTGCGNLRSIEVETDNPAYRSIDGVLLSENKQILHKCPEGKTGSFVIPSGVRRIVFGAFRDCGGLTGVTIPAGVTDIGGKVFCACRSLTGVTIPASVTSIAFGAFADCMKLERIEVEAGNPAYRSIDGVLFSKNSENLYRCPAGRTDAYVIPAGVKRIGDEAFRNCRNLTDLTIPESVTDIGYGAFSHCAALTDVTIPMGVTSIGNDTFSFCDSLRSVTIPEGVTEIGRWAFQNCGALRCLRLPDSLREIGPDALSWCVCEVRIRHWIPSLEEAMHGHEGILLHTDDPIEAIAESCRLEAALGFVAEEEFDGDSERTRSYLRWLTQHAGELIDRAFETPGLLKLLCLYGLIPPELFDAYLDAAEKHGDAELKALVLESLARIGPERVEQAREARLLEALGEDGPEGAGREDT